MIVLIPHALAKDPQFTSLSRTSGLSFRELDRELRLEPPFVQARLNRG